MRLVITYGYDTEAEEFFTPGHAEETHCQNVGFVIEPSANGKEWTFENGHHLCVRARYDGDVSHLSDIAMRGGAELISALNGDDEAHYT